MATRRRRSNPDSELDTTDLTHMALPGFAAYGATRLVSRVAFGIADKKKPSLSRYAAVGAGLAVTAAAWGLAGRVKQTKPYYEPILIGAGIAAAQSVVQTFLPRYSWLVGDLPSPSQPAASVAASSGPTLADLMQDDDLEVVPLLLPGQPAPKTAVTQAQANAQEQEDFIDAVGDYSEMNDAMF